jgi:ribosomal protein S18 acetylase RimI-like enzyme
MKAISPNGSSAARSPLVGVPESLRRKGVRLRPEIATDDPFLIALYRSTRERELAMVPQWSDEQKCAFVAQQFAAQRHHYRHALANVGFDVIERRGSPIGRLYTQERETQLHIVDIALSPEARGSGLGTAILEGLIAAAASAGKPVGIFVEQVNPALGLYRRLGFETIAVQDIYLEMERPIVPALAMPQLNTAS